MASEKANKVKDQSLVENSTTVKAKSTFREYAEAIIMALVLALFIRTFIVQAFKIPSGSMIPTLEIGDHILVNKLSYGVRMPFLERYLAAVRQRATRRCGGFYLSGRPVEGLYQAGDRGGRRYGGSSQQENSSSTENRSTIRTLTSRVTIRRRALWEAVTTTGPKVVPRGTSLSWATTETAATTAGSGVCQSR
jgi:hypothetical protein